MHSSQQRTNGFSMLTITLIVALLMLSFVGLLSGIFTYKDTTLPSGDVTATAQAQAAITAMVRTRATTSANIAITATAQARIFATAQAQAAVTATAGAQASATAGPLATASGGAPGYADALNDANNSGTRSAQWDGLDGNDSHCIFKPNGYHVITTLSNLHACQETAYQYGDATIAVDVTIVQGDSGGLFLRFGSGYNGYLFEISSTGKYKFSIFGGRVLQDWSSSSALKTGNNANTIAVIMRGDTFTLYANGAYMNTLEDLSYTYTAGNVALFASAPYANTTEVVFSNLKVYPHQVANTSLNRLVTTPHGYRGFLRGASSEGSVRAWDSFSSRASPARLMLMAALWSRSSEHPHEQLCQRCASSFLTIAPQPLHI
jgi:Concanavalin A-like lectin/glucanases superfamily